MRRAISFFFISVILFAIGLLLASNSLNAGIFAITLAFFYVVCPIISTKALSLIILVPLGAIYIALGLLGFGIILTICFIEFVLPYLAGYFLVVQAFQRFGPVISIILTIVFITLWFMLRKRQWKLIADTWEAFDVYWRLIRSLATLIENIWKSAGAIGQAIVRG